MSAKDLNKRKKRFGDRKEGRKLRSLSPMTYVFPHVSKNRIGCANYIKDCIDTENVEAYIKEKRAAGLKGFGFLHVFVAGYVRTLATHPGLNRFIAKEQLYSRYDIDITMAVKKELSLNAEETCIKITPKVDYTAEQVFKMLNAVILENKESKGDTSFESTARALSRMPGFIMNAAMGIIRLLDRWDLLPRSLIAVSPFHGSVFFTSMGSLGVAPVYHHLYEFGNMPMFISYGAKRRENVLNRDGEVVGKTFIDYTITTDDRTCDGHYYASALKQFKHILENPWQLDEPPKTIIEDVD